VPFSFLDIFYFWDCWLWLFCASTLIPSEDQWHKILDLHLRVILKGFIDQGFK